MIDAPAVQALKRAGVAVVVPSDGAAYDALRPNFNKRLGGRPALIALPHNVREAATAVRWCNEHTIPVHIRSGGHCYEGWSLPSGRRALIDLRALKRVDLRVTTDGRWQAMVGAGARVAEVLAVLQGKGLALPVGQCPDVGISGITLGGGIGLLTRKYGLTADHVVAMEAVLASGAVIEVTQSHADLLWALRGAGNGNFALVTSITFEPVILPEVIVYETTWRFQDLGTVISAWQTWAPQAPDDLASSFVAIFGPSKNFSIAGLITPSKHGSSLSDEAAARGSLQPLFEAVVPATPVSTATHRMRYADAAQHFWAAVPQPLAFKYKSAWVAQPLPASALGIISDALSALPEDAHSAAHVELVCMGGKVRQTVDDTAAFPYRQTRYLLECCAWWRPGQYDQERQLTAWARALHRELAPYVLPGASYLNSADDDVEEPEQGYYGPSADRLRRVKRGYDPTNVFSHAGSIKP